MDGSTFSGFLEVTKDQFRGTLAVPLMDRPRMGFDRDAEADGEMPAGTRTDWYKVGTYDVVATRVITPTGPRFWVHSSLPIRSHAEAMAYLGNSLKEATAATIEWNKSVEQWNADRLGMSLEAYKAMMRARTQRQNDLDDKRYVARGGLGR